MTFEVINFTVVSSVNRPPERISFLLFLEKLSKKLERCSDGRKTVSKILVEKVVQINKAVEKL